MPPARARGAGDASTTALASGPAIATVFPAGNRLADALQAFQAAMAELGAADRVTTFTASDFGRAFSGRCMHEPRKPSMNSCMVPKSPVTVIQPNYPEPKKAGEQPRQINGHHLPHDIQVDSEIVMNDDVPESGNRSLGNIGRSRFGCITQALTGLSHGLQVADDSVLDQPGRLEYSLVAFAVFEHARNAGQHVLNINLVGLRILLHVLWKKNQSNTDSRKTPHASWDAKPGW